MAGRNATLIPHGDAAAQDDTRLLTASYWPELSVAVFRAQMRVDTTITDDRVVAALQAAAIDICLELDAMRHTYPLAPAFADIPSDMFDGVSVLCIQFRRAVYSTAKAVLIETYRDFDSTQDGHDEADALETMLCTYRRDAREAVRIILGRPRTRVVIL